MATVIGYDRRRGGLRSPVLKTPLGLPEGVRRSIRLCLLAAEYGGGRYLRCRRRNRTLGRSAGTIEGAARFGKAYPSNVYDTCSRGPSSKASRST